MLIVSSVGDRRRKALRQRPKPDGAPKWQPARDFGDRLINVLYCPPSTGASPIDFVWRCLDAASDAGTNGKNGLLITAPNAVVEPIHPEDAGDTDVQ